MLPSGLPERTLGWQVLQWSSEMLAQPNQVNVDGQVRYSVGDSWKFSDEQALFILWFYALDDYGRFLYKQAIIERSKGWGKSPLLAGLCCAELLGPVIFAGWDANGAPVGRENESALVQIAALSERQTNNTMALVLPMLTEGKAIEYYRGLDPFLSKISYKGRHLERVTASPRGLEGNRATFAVLDETHLWLPSEKGPELYEAIDRNLGKMGGRYVCTTNAHAPGEESVAEFLYHQFQDAINGTGFDSKTMFDTREVFLEDFSDKATVMDALRFVYGDAADPDTGWIDLESIYLKVMSSREHVARRFYFNQHIEGHSAWLTPARWNDCKTEEKKLRKGDVIALGFKGNTVRGAALVGCRLEDGELFELGWWENPKWENANLKNDWEVPFKDVDARIRKILERYNVAKLFGDPAQYQDIIGRWYSDYEDEVEEFWISNKTKMARAVEQFETAVNDKRLGYFSNKISRHVMSCHTDEVPQGHVIRQENKHSNRYIFGAQAAVLAFEAATVAIEEGFLKSKPDNTLYTF